MHHHHCTAQHFCVDCRMNTLSQTSYFCLLNWYCSSKFSASSSYIHSHSSLAFSLGGGKHTEANEELFFSVPKSMKVSPKLSGIFFFIYLLEFVLVQVLDVQRFATLTQNLLFLLSLRLPFPTALLCLWVSAIECLMTYTKV